MVSEHASSELERTASWPVVRSGLTLLVVTWLVSTALGVSVQLAAMQLDPGLRVGEPSAIGLLAIWSLVYQALYGVIAVLVVVSAVKLTRAPPSAGVITPALVAAASYLLVLLVNAVLLVSRFGGEAAQSSDLGGQLSVVLTAARACGVIALVLALVRLGRATSSPRPSAVVGGAFALGALDTGYPLYRVLANVGASEPQSVTERGLLLGVQVLLAFAIVDLALAGRRGVRAVIAAAPASSPAAATEHETEHEHEHEREHEHEHEHEREREHEHEHEREQGATLVWTAALLAGAGIGFLPAWDAVSAASSVAELAGVGVEAELAGRPLAPFVYTALGVAVVFSLVRLLRTAPYLARLVWLGAAAISFHYVVVTAMEVAEARSRLVDDWIVCESGLDVRGNVVSHGPAYAGPYDGPRDEAGRPCIRAAERRDVHAELEPRGGLRDGLVQIGMRFPVERRRILWGSIAVLVALGVSGWLTARAGAAPPPREDAPKKTKTRERRPAG